MPALSAGTACSGGAPRAPPGQWFGAAPPGRQVVCKICGDLRGESPHRQPWRAVCCGCSAGWEGGTPPCTGVAAATAQSMTARNPKP